MLNKIPKDDEEIDRPNRPKEWTKQSEAGKIIENGRKKSRISSRISFLFLILSPCSFISFVFFELVLHSGRTFIHICDLLLYFIYFSFHLFTTKYSFVVACTPFTSARSCSCARFCLSSSCSFPELKMHTHTYTYATPHRVLNRTTKIQFQHWLLSNSFRNV